MMVNNAKAKHKPLNLKLKRAKPQPTIAQEITCKSELTIQSLTLFHNEEPYSKRRIVSFILKSVKCFGTHITDGSVISLMSRNDILKENNKGYTTTKLRPKSTKKHIMPQITLPLLLFNLVRQFISLNKRIPKILCRSCSTFVCNYIHLPLHIDISNFSVYK